MANPAIAKMPRAIMTSINVNALTGRQRVAWSGGFTRSGGCQKQFALIGCQHRPRGRPISSYLKSRGSNSTEVRPVVTSVEILHHSFLSECKINVISSEVPFG